MPTVVLKLFADKGPDGQTMRRLYASPFGEHKNNTHKTHKYTRTNQIMDAIGK